MKRWALVAVIAVSETALVWSHPHEAKWMARAVYVTIWNALPKPGGVSVPPPNRFAP
jgi:hypothetical protein